MKYVTRYIEYKIKTYLKQFPVILLTGPRQSGKSTLLKHLFNTDKWSYISLDQRGTVERIKSDPDLFAKDIHSNIIVDEAQKIPDLFESIKWRVDKGMKHKVILSGSANFQLMQQVSESLAGRAGIIRLYPFTLSEKYNRHNILELILDASNIKELIKKLKMNKPLDDKTIFKNILWGGYPKLIEYKTNDLIINWFENYLTTYIERDLRDLAQVADLSDFQKFYKILSFQSGELTNLNSIANNIGVTVPTCKKYLQILEISYQYFRLNPYHINIRKRLIKTPKIYNWDTGILNFLIENESETQLLNSNKWGNILENFIITEIMKQNSFLKKKRNMYFWRTSNGAEIDLIIEHQDKLIPIEIKSGVKITNNNIRGLKDFIELKINKNIPFGIIFYRGEDICRYTENILLIPIGYL